MKKDNAAKLVSSALLGYDFVTVLVAGHRYVIHPPTIKRLAGAGYYLSDIAGVQTLADIFTGQTDIKAVCSALSWFIQGDDALRDELLEGTMKEVTDALLKAYALIGVQPFMKLSVLARSVASLIAQQKQ